MWRRTSILLLFGLMAWAVLWRLGEDRDPARALRNATWKTFFRLRGPVAPPSDIFVVAVAKEDFEAIGSWPWPRTTVVRILSRVAAAGPDMLALLFTYTTIRPPLHRLLLQAVRRYPLLEIENSGLEVHTDSLQGSFGERAEEWLSMRLLALAVSAPLEIPFFVEQRFRFLGGLQEALAMPGNQEMARVAAGLPTCVQNIAAPPNSEVVETHVPMRRSATQDFVPFAGLDTSGKPDPGVRASIPSVDPRFSNFKELREAADCQGMFAPWADYTRVAWRLPLVVRDGERLYPAMPLAIAAKRLGVKPRVIFHRGGFEIRLGERRIPTDDAGRLYLSHYGPATAFAAASCDDVLNGRLPVLAGRLVFLSQTTAYHQYFPISLPSPFGGQVSQMEVVITATANLLDNSAMHYHGGSGFLLLLGGLLTGLQLWQRRRAWLVIALGVGGGAGAFLLAYAAFRVGHLFDPVPLVAWFVPGTLAVVGLSIREQNARRRQVERAFGAYLSPQVLKEVLHHPEALRPGGQRREITVLFSDIRNFTTISERRDPALVSELLNLYLEAMAGCIVRHGGVIDKFIGDGILAFFGAPVAQADHARRALASARDMLSALNTVRSVWRERGVDELRIGIGLHTGEAIVGNLGSAERLDYTVIGDTVNTASRVESATKDLKVSLLFTAATRTRLGPETSCQAMGCISVKGREQALEVFTLEEPGKDPRMVQS